jgi:hypothetical protein
MNQKRLYFFDLSMNRIHSLTTTGVKEMWSKISKFYYRDDHVKNQKVRVEGGARAMVYL